MYPFPQSANPAVRSCIDAQTAFFNGLSQTISRSMQQVIQMNMQLGQGLIEETTSTARNMLGTERPTDALSAAAARAQPATDKLRLYQQQLSQIAAATQVELNSVTAQHVQETSRTARALADEVARVSVEETENSLREREAMLKNSRDASSREAEPGPGGGARFPGNPQSGGAAAAKPDGQSRPPNGSGNTQGGHDQAGSKASSPAR